MASHVHDFDASLDVLHVALVYPRQLDDRKSPVTHHLPDSLRLERCGDVAVVSLDRVSKRNALDSATVVALGDFFRTPPEWVKAAVLAAEGDHFCAGLDLGDLKDGDAAYGLHHSRMWHHAFEAIELGTIPVVAALKGAVIGGGLELATAAHIRVSEPSTYFALPEGRRGLFVGGGASVRVPRLIGAHRMADMMLTGRVFDATEGERLGLTSYLVGDGQARAKAIELAEAVATNAPLSNYAVLQALPRIAEASSTQGYLMESLMSAVAQSSDDAKQRLADFLSGRAAKVTKAAR